MTVKRVLASVVVAGATVAVLAVVFHAATEQWPSGMGDMQSYWHAAEALRAGGWGVYDPSELPDGVWPYLYPPSFVGAFAVLLLLPVPVALGAWALFVAGSVVLAFLVLRALGDLAPREMLFLGMALALPTFQLLVMGQVDALVVGLLGMALLAERRSRPGLTGALIGVAAAIKVVPALALLPFLVLRRWTVAAFGLLAGGLMSLLPVLWLLPELGVPGAIVRLGELHLVFVDQVLIRGLGQRAAGEWMLLPTNTSLQGTALRLLGEARWGAAAMWLLVGIGTWTTLRTRGPAMGVALIVTGAALGNFVFWPHSVFLFGLPLALAFPTVGSALLLAAFVAATWINPVLGTVGYLAVWGSSLFNADALHGRLGRAGRGASGDASPDEASP